MAHSPAEAFEAALVKLRTLLGDRLVAERRLERETARQDDLDPALPPALATALAQEGIGRLWSHQVAALRAVRAGCHVLVTTATASGKSLVFQLPVLEERLAGGRGRAIFLFPLKALGQDQRGKLLTLAQAAGLDADDFACEIYDGDTPALKRALIRRRPPQVLVTNPDMLHLGILAHPGNWHELLANLKWIVLDELHVYRGLFGSHFHHVLQRLLRLARLHGAHPAIIASSATAQNAREFAELLAAEPFVEITGSGAPREARRIFLTRPEASPYTLTLDLLVALVGAGQKTIVFTKARRITELLYGWLQRKDPTLARRVACYRAGFLPEERREIEAKLQSGELDAVISTSALELGIDIGGLDACLLVGFPGSMMATWQRSGRVGRRGRESLTALVALPDALDQYLLEHPDELLARPCEPLLFDPENEPVARLHLECAAAENPLSRTEDARYLERHAAVVGDLLREGTLAEARDGGGLVARRRRPHRDVNLRGTGATFVLVDRTRGTTIGTLDGNRVYSEGHPGAVYLHHGRQYEVAELDLDRRRVIVQPAEVDFFTSPLSRKETEILEVLEQREVAALDAALARLRITEQVTGFERKRTQGQEVIDQQPLDLPSTVMECVGFWLRLPGDVVEELAANGRHLLGSLHAAEHATIGLLPLLALCDRNDLGGISLAFHPQLDGAGYFVYEGHSGGMGIAKKGFRELETLLAKVRDHLSRCTCEDGCPSCIQSPKCGNGNRPLDKRGAIDLLTMLLDPDRPTSSRLPTPIVPAPARELAPAAGEPAVRKSAVTRKKDSVKGVVGQTSSRELRDRGSPASVDSEGSPEAQRPAAGAHATPFLYRKNAPAVESSARAERVSVAVVRRPGPTVLFDIETMRSAAEVGGWNKAHKMGLALAVVCHLEEGRFETFLEPRAVELAATLKSAGLVIGFNSRRFDYAVLSGYTGEDYARTLPTLDLLDTMVSRLGRRVSLDHLTKETLGAGKTADGLQSLRWVKEGRFDLIEEYCRRDVELLRDLYLFGRREGHVWIADRSGRVQVPVDW
ncbi:MAG: DEAD/DEAH box helicase [Thermoanaerobaculia bacterium]